MCFDLTTAEPIRQIILQVFHFILQVKYHISFSNMLSNTEGGINYFFIKLPPCDPAGFDLTVGTISLDHAARAEGRAS
jgi:hypothetical protein